eukprot:8213062-Pyramimonas_sp.AAC.1
MPKISRGACKQQPRRRHPDQRCPGPPGPARPLLLPSISRPINQMGPRRSPKIGGSSETPNVPRSWE